MKTTRRSLQILFFGAALAGLAACGGGGGGSSDATQPPASAPPPAPAPSATGSGLPPPSATISQSASTAIQLATRVGDVFRSARGGAATIALGAVRPTPGATQITCPNGGTVVLSGPSAGMTATYSACAVGSYTFNGTATMATSGDAGALSGMQIDYGALEASGPGGFAATLSGRTTCTAASGGFLCTSDYNDIAWGADFRYDFAAEAASGTSACECGPEHVVDVVASGLTQVGGSAQIAGASGSAAVTRTSATTYRVVLTSGGTTITYDPVTIAP